MATRSSRAAEIELVITRIFDAPRKLVLNENGRVECFCKSIKRWEAIWTGGLF